MPAEPRWDIDLEYGKQGELQIKELLLWIAQGNGTVEVKKKRILDFQLFVETECDKGRTGHYEPSGISVSEAKVYAFVIGDTGISVMIPTPLLKASLSHKTARPMAGPRGSCPTRGYLVNLAAILATAAQTVAAS